MNNIQMKISMQKRNEDLEEDQDISIGGNRENLLAIRKMKTKKNIKSAKENQEENEIMELIYMGKAVFV